MKMARGPQAGERALASTGCSAGFGRVESGEGHGFVKVALGSARLSKLVKARGAKAAGRRCGKVSPHHSCRRQGQACHKGQQGCQRKSKCAHASDEAEGLAPSLLTHVFSAFAPLVDKLRWPAWGSSCPLMSEWEPRHLSPQGSFAKALSRLPREAGQGSHVKTP